MTRLIDADALKLSHCKECSLYPNECMGKDCDCGAIIHINEMPTIDAEPVRHGKWIWNDKCRRVCSVCENPVAFMLSRDGWHEGKYCPNCGCRMDVE